VELAATARSFPTPDPGRRDNSSSTPGPLAQWLFRRRPSHLASIRERASKRLSPTGWRPTSDNKTRLHKARFPLHTGRRPPPTERARKFILLGPPTQQVGDVLHPQLLCVEGQLFSRNTFLVRRNCVTRI